MARPELSHRDHLGLVGGEERQTEAQLVATQCFVWQRNVRQQFKTIQNIFIRNLFCKMTIFQYIFHRVWIMVWWCAPNELIKRYYFSSWDHVVTFPTCSLHFAETTVTWKLYKLSHHRPPHQVFLSTKLLQSVPPLPFSPHREAKKKTGRNRISPTEKNFPQDLFALQRQSESLRSLWEDASETNEVVKCGCGFWGDYSYYPLKFN